MKFQNPVKSLGVLGLIILITSSIDLLFYLPTSGDVFPFVAMKVLFGFAGAYFVWEHLLKPAMGKTGYLSDTK